MADVRVFDTPLAVAYEDAMAALQGVLAGVPDAQETFSQKHGNTYLHGSPASLLEAARVDHMVRAEHGQAIMLQALALALAAQDRRIRELEAGPPRSKRSGKK